MRKQRIANVPHHRWPTRSSKENSSSTASQSTALTEAASPGSSFHSDLAEVFVSTPLSPSASGNRYAIKSSLKRKNSSSRLPKDTRISFSHEALQRIVMGLHEFSTNELKACWFRGDEYAAVTKSCLKLIKKLNKGGSNLRDQDEQFCTRGLESHTQLAGLAKAKTRRDAWDAVLFEQEEQISLGVIDEETIALRYQDISSSCQLWACKVALDDQKAAQLVYGEDTLDEV